MRADAIDHVLTMVLVDTNILAYLLIAGDRTEMAQSLYERDADWRSEAFLLIEFSNILATYQRNGYLNSDQSVSLLNEAETCMRNLIAIPHITALQTAQRFAVSAYDARFLAAAEKLSTKLVTEDTKLRAAAPTLTQSLIDVVSIGLTGTSKLADDCNGSAVVFRLEDLNDGFEYQPVVRLNFSTCRKGTFAGFHSGVATCRARSPLGEQNLRQSVSLRDQNR